MSTATQAAAGHTPVIADLDTHPPQPEPAGLRHGAGFWSVAAAFAVILGFSAIPTPPTAHAAATRSRPRPPPSRRPFRPD
jgi:hypothetical protein